jgi:hypothetical protein
VHVHEVGFDLELVATDELWKELGRRFEIASMVSKDPVDGHLQVLSTAKTALEVLGLLSLGQQAVGKVLFESAPGGQ